MNNPYTTLGVAKDATLPQIKAAWRKLAQEHHPDKGGDVKTFQAIQEAYELLSDPERRDDYDATGNTSRGPDIMTQARENIMKTFLQMCDIADIDTTNIVELIRRNIWEHKNQLTQKRKVVEKSIRQRESMLRRLKKKDGGNDFVKVALEESILELSGNFRLIEEAQKIDDKGLEILDGYDYSFDSAVFSTIGTGTNTFFRSTGASSASSN